MTSVQRIAAWGVHLYTASGLALAAGIAVLIVQGDPESFYWAFGLMWLATFIDATDGVLARRLKVKERVPEFDGRRLDDLTDFLTYTFLPLLLVWRAGLVAQYSPWLLFPLLASAYGFCQVSAKTDDGFFLGFPSYWNLIAMYLFFLRLPPVTALIFILGFAALTFVPFRYLYSTQPGKLNRYTNVLGGLWAAFVAYILYRGLHGADVSEIKTLALYSLTFPIYYLVASWVVTWRLSQ